MKISEAQQLIDEWIKKFGVRYFNELTNTAVLMEELADVLFVLICIANQTGINLETALKHNLDKKTNRDSTRHLNNEKLN
jgi:NTP pyrophosphatase (non-canonical NTP hydrolase)